MEKEEGIRVPHTTMQVSWELRDRIDRLKKQLGKDHLYEALEIVIEHFENCRFAKTELVFLPAE